MGQYHFGYHYVCITPAILNSGTCGISGNKRNKYVNMDVFRTDLI